MKKVIYYTVIAVISFMLGTVCSGKIFAEKTEAKDDVKYEQILKKLDDMSKTQNETLELVKVIRVRVR
jgi:hypothetical protein